MGESPLRVGSVLHIVEKESEWEQKPACSERVSSVAEG